MVLFHFSVPALFYIVCFTWLVQLTYLRTLPIKKKSVKEPNLCITWVYIGYVDKLCRIMSKSCNTYDVGYTSFIAIFGTYKPHKKHIKSMSEICTGVTWVNKRKSQMSKINLRIANIILLKKIQH
jgi:hypothetical protein